MPNDFGGPEPGEGAGFESALDEVRCGPCSGVAACGVRAFAPRHARQAHLSHQPSHAFAPDPDTILGEFGVNARRPTGAAAALVNGADARLERLVALCSHRGGSRARHTESASRANPIRGF